MEPDEDEGRDDQGRNDVGCGTDARDDGGDDPEPLCEPGERGQGVDVPTASALAKERYRQRCRGGGEYRGGGKS